MEDSPNEVQNIASPTKIDEVDEPKTVEELQKELDLLKAENTKTKRNLMWKVRKLEKDKILTENEKIVKLKDSDHLHLYWLPLLKSLMIQD